ncbi:MAG: PAS domain S-box protein, partial [Allosphingosinicella sp.]
HEAESRRPEADLDRALRDGRFTEEIWQTRKDESEFLADVTITPLLGPEGSLRGFAKAVRDVTDRRAAERALEKRERHLQSILATVPEAMIVIDEHGIMISFSAAAERLFGYAEGDVLGRNVSMLMPSPDRERHDAYIERYLDTGERRIIGLGRIVTGLRADGSTFPMKLSVGEALSDDQRLFTGFVQDLTERQNFEARLEELKSELIHVSRLSAMGTMASTLAHELNQPLTAIANYAEAAGTMLESGREVDAELMREIMADMSAQSLRAGAIVRRLRDFVARGEVAKTVEKLPDLINEAGALALVGSREKGIVVQFHYGEDATPVLVDRVQIQQVLMNLMRNAVEAMEGCPVRRLSVSTALLDPATVQVTVADTGPGIAPEMADRLFEAFASTKSSGMGLGLSICRTIVEAHGGRIRAHSPEGGGTEFQFTLLRPEALP